MRQEQRLWLLRIKSVGGPEDPVATNRRLTHRREFMQKVRILVPPKSVVKLVESSR